MTTFLTSAVRCVLGLGFLIAAAHPGWTQADALPSWNDGAAKKSIIDFVARVTAQGGADFVPVDRAHRNLRQRRHAVERAAGLFPDRVCVRSHQGARPAAPGMEDQAAVQDGPRRATRSRAGAKLGEKGLLQIMAATHTGMTVEEFDEAGAGLARHRAPSPLQPALHRAGLPADAGTARLSARQRLQDLHRVRRRHRVHAALDREGLRHSARAGGRLVGHHQVRDSTRTASPV